MTGRWVFDSESIWDFLGYVIECAPNFPTEDYLEPHEQLDVVKAFDELSIGLGILKNTLKPDLHIHAQSLLQTALDAYQSGDEFKGAKTLQEFESLLFPD